VGGPKRDLETYVKLIPPKPSKPEPSKRVLPEDISLERAAFGRDVDKWQPPKDSTGVKMIQKYQIFETTEIAGEIKRVAGPVFSNKAQAEDHARMSLDKPEVTAVEVIDVQTGKRVFPTR
jgi:hypothetical protein